MLLIHNRHRRKRTQGDDEKKIIKRGDGSSEDLERTLAATKHSVELRTEDRRPGVRGRVKSQRQRRLVRPAIRPMGASRGLGCGAFKKKKNSPVRTRMSCYQKRGTPTAVAQTRLADEAGGVGDGSKRGGNTVWRTFRGNNKRVSSSKTGP